MTEPNETTVPLGSIGGDAPVIEPTTTAKVEKEGDAIRPLEPDEIRARRRPLAIALVWAWEPACAFVIATPVHAWARRVWGAHPDGDAVLFRPGGDALLSWLGDDTASLAIVLRTTILTLLVFGLLGQIVTGALITSLSTGRGESGRAPPPSFALRAGAAAVFPLLAIEVVSGALEAIVLGTGLFVSAGLDRSVQTTFGDAKAFTARVVVLALFVLVMLVIGVVADLVRVTVVRDVALDIERRERQRRTRDGVVRGLRAAGGALGRVILAWSWRAAIALGLVCLGAVAGDVASGRGDGALWALFFVHQLVVLGRASLRASWLANAQRLVLRSAA
jgi:hypothetical protein